MPRYLFPKIPLTSKTAELNKLEFYDSSNNELLVREYGQSNEPCIIFFSGRHGGVKKYEDSLFSAFQRNGFKVFSISYPGQDGATGRVDSLTTLIELTNDAIRTISIRCSPEKSIVYGRSLGATVATYSLRDTKVSGIILEGVAPSLSIAVQNHLNSKWYLSPLQILPTDLLLQKDYKLSESLSLLKATPVSIFQGVNDTQTPLRQLKKSWDYGDNVSLHVVKKGQHSNAYVEAEDEIIAVAKRMLGR